MKKIISIIVIALMVLSTVSITSYATTQASVDWAKIEVIDSDDTASYYEYYTEEGGVIYKCIVTKFNGSETTSIKAYAVAFLGAESTIITVADKVYFEKIDKTVSVNAVKLYEDISEKNYCETLEKIIGYNVYEYLKSSSITEINISDGVESVEGIKDFENLEKITLGKDVKKINNSFYNCPKTTVVVSEENTNFSIEDTRLLSKDKKTQYFEFEATATYKVKKGIQTLYLNFNDSNAVEKVIVPYKLKSIINNGYSGKFGKIKEIKFYENAKVTEKLRLGNKYLTKITYSKKQKFTGDLSRSKIKSITLPESITKISKNSFYKCKELKKVYINSKTKAPKIKKGAFRNTTKGIKFYAKNKTVAKQLKKRLKGKGVKNARIYIGKKLIYKGIK